MKKYNAEKVLYFANTECGFNLSVDEHKARGRDFRQTNLEEIVDGLLKEGLIKEVAKDEVDVYYRTTKSGEVALLNMQIQWRKSRNKDVSKHELKLKELTC